MLSACGERIERIFVGSFYTLFIPSLYSMFFYFSEWYKKLSKLSPTSKKHGVIGISAVKEWVKVFLLVKKFFHPYSGGKKPGCISFSACIVTTYG